MIETAFSDEERALAEISRHLSPSMLAEELQQLDLDCDTSIAITHVKPGEMAAVANQLAELDIRMPVFALTRGELHTASERPAQSRSASQPVRRISRLTTAMKMPRTKPAPWRSASRAPSRLPITLATAITAATCHHMPLGGEQRDRRQIGRGVEQFGASRA